MTIKATEITKCKECDSTSLSWETHNKTDSGVPEGRLRSSEVKCQFVLGCDNCSETLAIVSADKVASLMNEQFAAERLVSANKVSSNINSATKTLTVADLCELNDLSVTLAEKALHNLQEKGLVSGFVAGDLHAQITLTAEAAKYFD